jgi:hypothetical protein
MSPKLLQQVGEALYGPRWQSDLARDLEIDDRSIRRYLAGEREIPDDMPDQLRQVLADRRAALDRAAKLLLGK